MNVVIFMTDQERYIQHFPPGWAKRHLPGLTELMNHGITFENSTTNSCMCSPARSTLMSGFFPAQHGVKYTLEESMPASTFPQVELPGPSEMANLATVMSAAGYHVVYKGKWHCSKPAWSVWTPADLAAYGFSRWNPQDAGANQSMPEMGAGIAQNDARYMASTGDATDGNEGVLQFLNSTAASMQPFVLIVSLVNPHDVLAYPKSYEQAGFSSHWLNGEIGLPSTVDEDLSTKPTAQRAFLKISTLLGPLNTRERKLAYLNFYGNLMKASDQHLVQVIAALKSITTASGSSLYVVFTYDDWQAGQATGPYVPPPQHVLGIRETRWKIAQYFDPTGARKPQWELYDLAADPRETTNLADPDYARTKAQDAQFARLKDKLADVQATRLQPLPTTIEWQASA